MSEVKLEVVEGGKQVGVNNTVNVIDETPLTPEEPAKEERKSEFKVYTQTELDELPVDEKLKTIDTYAEVINLASQQNTAHREVCGVLNQRNEMGKFMKSNDEYIDPMDVVNRKLATVPDTDTLEKDYLPYPEKVAWFFTDDDTGNEVEVNLPNDTVNKDTLEFQRDMLRFFKRCDDAIADYDKISKEAEEQLKEINADIDEINKLMGNNVLSFVQALRENTSPDSSEYKKVMDTCDGIMSGYTFSMAFDTLEEYPSVVRNTLEDFKSPHRIKNIADRYFTAISKARTAINLVTFIGGKGTGLKSIEPLALSGFYRPGTEDLFVFILMRWFAMNKITSIKDMKFHASAYLVLHQLSTNQLSDEAYDMVLENMKKLLSKFYEQMPSPV